MVDIDDDSFVVKVENTEIREKRLDIAALLQSIFEKKVSGIFGCVHPDAKTKTLIKEFFKDVDIPDLIDPSEYHVTVIYDKNHDLDDFDIPEDVGSQKAKFDSYALYGQNKDCLVMKLKSPGLERVFESLKDLGLDHSFPEYSPHLTLSYNGADVDPETLPKPDFEFSFFPVLFVEAIDDDFKSKVKTT